MPRFGGLRGPFDTACEAVGGRGAVRRRAIDLADPQYAGGFIDLPENEAARFDVGAGDAGGASCPRLHFPQRVCANPYRVAAAAIREGVVGGPRESVDGTGGRTQPTEGGVGYGGVVRAWAMALIMRAERAAMSASEPMKVGSEQPGSG